MTLIRRIFVRFSIRIGFKSLPRKAPSINVRRFLMALAAPCQQNSSNRNQQADHKNKKQDQENGQNQQLYQV